MQFDWAFGALLLAAHSCFLTISYILALINANLKHLLAYFQRQTWLMILILVVSFIFLDTDSQRIPCRVGGGTNSHCINLYTICSCCTDFRKGSKSF